MESESWPNKLPMTEIQSQWSVDIKGEKIINRFLNDFLYSRTGRSYQTITDKNQQFRGVDTKMTLFNGKVISIDEKCQLNRLNQTPITQCLELGFYNDTGTFRNGWFTRETDTEYYLFTWIPKCKVDSKYNLTYESIDEVAAMLVSKKKLEKHLKKTFNIDKETLRFPIAKMICNNHHQQKETNGTKTNYVYLLDNKGNWIHKQRVRFTMSLSLKEKSINMVVFFSEYAKIYEDIFIITRDSIKSTKKNGEIIWPIQKI